MVRTHSQAADLARRVTPLVVRPRYRDPSLGGGGRRMRSCSNRCMTCRAALHTHVHTEWPCVNHDMLNVTQTFELGSLTQGMALREPLTQWMTCRGASHTLGHEGKDGSMPCVAVALFFIKALGGCQGNVQVGAVR
eukprot:1148520-Pelagomonas_calceolata.AAC.5